MPRQHGSSCGFEFCLLGVGFGFGFGVWGFRALCEFCWLHFLTFMMCLSLTTMTILKEKVLEVRVRILRRWQSTYHASCQRSLHRNAAKRRPSQAPQLLLEKKRTGERMCMLYPSFFHSKVYKFFFLCSNCWDSLFHLSTHSEIGSCPWNGELSRLVLRLKRQKGWMFEQKTTSSQRGCPHSPMIIPKHKAENNLIDQSSQLKSQNSKKHESFLSKWPTLKERGACLLALSRHESSWKRRSGVYGMNHPNWLNSFASCSTSFEKCPVKTNNQQNYRIIIYIAIYILQLIDKSNNRTSFLEWSLVLGNCHAQEIPVYPRLARLSYRLTGISRLQSGAGVSLITCSRERTSFILVLL